MMLEVLIGLIVAGAIGIVIGLAWHVIGIAYSRWKNGKRDDPRPH
jgi:hypothetical protein